MMKSTLALALCAAALLTACGKSDTPTATTPAPAPAPVAAPAPAPAAPENTVGKSIYGKTCAMCHAAGVGGAPKPGDKADWDARMAQGMDVLVKHATEGFTGQKGMMPPKGGNAALTDADIKAAVAYMATK